MTWRRFQGNKPFAHGTVLQEKGYGVMGGIDLKGKTALVTGGARGIGFVTAKRLASAGASIALVDLFEDAVGEAAEKLGAESKGYIADVTDSAAVAETVKKIKEDFEKIDILINNAGITADGLLIRMTDEQWSKVLSVNLTGAFYVLRETGKVMLKQRSGSIVNITSVVGVMGNAGQANYVSSKAGLIGLTKTASKEFARRGVRVNAIAPGYIQTPMTDKLKDEVKQQMKAMIPLGVFGTPENIAGAVLFLASELSSYITGQVLLVDGGMVM